MLNVGEVLIKDVEEIMLVLDGLVMKVKRGGCKIKVSLKMEMS